MKTGFCPNCEMEFTYLTERDFIIHAPCNKRVEVEPCDPEPVEEIPNPEVIEDGTDI